MSKDATATLKATEPADGVSVKVEQGKTLKTHPDLSEWLSMEINKRISAITESGFRFQTQIMKADREVYLTQQELNLSTEEGDAEQAARAVFTLAEKKKKLAELKTQLKKETAEKLILEKEYREREDRLHNAERVQVFEAKRGAVRI